ncbi:UDP-Glycosyltransferase/glycogen phosphorylase [Eremomyces bilateralis CBS 781.70]|uniref:UDP-Glycosyltransferase/glycogen phosphorylase n=1 Tax=Eremomyces bilateralis CBS 781.70 TaxID=1392243 RepID=A0A6G1FRQ6_9PEZI|nr:UDP-Glycosyltransferase/glycogen phosphorylase [Eremomyces bilateralis CBS 781.70]KAF1808474.1 UDP-Glycosyltransferase/glycogen phosphorylase [Eremomyces bilateralis CBS 781.70]
MTSQQPHEDPPQEGGQGTNHARETLASSGPESTQDHPRTTIDSLSQPQPEHEDNQQQAREGAQPWAGRRSISSIDRVSTVDSFYRSSTRESQSTLDADVPPSTYSDTYGQIRNENEGLRTDATVGADGRVDIHIDQRPSRLSALVVPALRKQLDLVAQGPTPPAPFVPPELGGAPGQVPPPSLNVVIHVVGSRGDVQPFVALGKVLKETYGHRVRLATHPVFQEFVTENGLEFFSIGGDPAELMAFMVKNPGLMPGFDTLRSGDIGKRRKGIVEMLNGCWRSCYEVGDGLGPEATDESFEEWMSEDAHTNPGVDPVQVPFVADAIIANPPSFAHVHCAERLGVPLHMMFTMPWSPTQSFPHPLANIQSSNADPGFTNSVSYSMVDMLTWQGLGDVINRFRVHRLGLDPISLMWAPGLLSRLKVPYTYCWSPALIPKPKDWGPHISIAGFYFLSLASNYTPVPDLKEFLDAGPPPVYIGFGSIVVDDPNGMTRLIFDAIAKTGQRALVSKGWGGLGADSVGLPDGVFMLGNVPHDWLFQHVSCVVHHGGAGTTAAGIAAGRPTVVVPFFGDQPFWGAMVNKAGAGPEPIPYKELTADKLADALLDALKPSSLERARDLADMIKEEQGCQVGAQKFHQMLDLDTMRCQLMPEKIAVWKVRRAHIRLSAAAATALVMEGVIMENDLKPFRAKEYDADDGPWDPISGGAAAIMGTMSSMMMGVADLPIATLKALRVHPDAAKKKQKADKAGEGGSAVTGTSTRGDLDRTSTHSSIEAQCVTSPTAAAPTEASDTLSLAPVPGNDAIDSHLSPAVLTPTGSSAKRSHVDSANLGGDSAPLAAQATITQNQSNSIIPQISHPESLHESRSDTDTPAESTHSSQIGRSRSAGSESTPTETSTHPRTRSVGPNPAEPEDGSSHSPSPFTLDTAYGTGKGFTRIAGAGLKAPMDFTMAVAKGFHNVPRMYGEEVRPAGRVTGIKSGLKTAGKEFGLDLFEGITGVVTQPIEGAKKDGAAGLAKGFGKGLAGLFLKPTAAGYALPAYAFKGIYKEIQKRYGSAVRTYIITARSVQGFQEYIHMTPEQRRNLVHGYLHLLKETRKKKPYREQQLDAIHAKNKARKEKKKATQNKKNGTNESLRSSSTAGVSDMTPIASSSVSQISQAYSNTDQQLPPDSDRARRMSDPDLEAAILRSIEETTAGDPSEDELIARAIRASMAELQGGTTRRPEATSGMSEADMEAQEEEALQRALKASVAEATKAGASDEEARQLEEVIRLSLQEQSAKHVSPSPEGAGPSVRTGAEDECEDPDEHEEEQLRLAIEESRREMEKLRATEEPRDLEDSIVMEYVNQKSMAEETQDR